MSASPQPFNPCSLGENEQIPAKIWELLRRNLQFRAEFKALKELDASARRARRQKTKSKYRHVAGDKSWQLVEKVSDSHPFAGVALQYLVPEPLFHATRVVRSSGEIQIGEGTSPNLRNKSKWRWWPDARRANHEGRLNTRGPELHWKEGDKVNPLQEWQVYPWPFTVDHAWPDAPAPFRRQFQFIWRHSFDSRPLNPLSNSRSDSPMPHETNFFQSWQLENFKASGNLSQAELYAVVKFNELAEKYRVFAVPRQLLSRQAAKAAFASLVSQVAKDLPDERQLFGTKRHWHDFQAVENLKSEQGNTDKRAVLSHVYQGYGGTRTPLEKRQTHETDVTRRVEYLQRLRDNIYPAFILSTLLQPFQHRRSKHPRQRSK